jgi:acetolactate synthase-1/2/3 large subunit
VQLARTSGRAALVEFRVEKEEAVYPMVPSGADLHAMIRRPHADALPEAADGAKVPA